MERKRVLYIFLSSLLLVLSFPPFDLEPLAWVAFVPLFVALDGSRRRGAFLLGLLWGLLFFTGILYWISYAVRTYGGLSLPVSLSINLLLLLYLSLYPALFALLIAGRPGPLSIPLFWVSLEYLRGHLFTGFPWALLGYSQWRFLHILQIADITGVYGISFIIILFNAGLFLLIARRRYLPFLVAGALVLLALAYGHVRMGQVREALKDMEVVRVGVVQGNIPQGLKWNEAYRDRTVRIYMEETRNLLEDSPHLVVWPETAIPFYLQTDRVYTPKILSMVREESLLLLTGSPAFEMGKRVRYYNSAFLLGREGILGRYDKIHLVPFGEYVPLRRVLFFADKLVAGAGDFSPGKGVKLLGKERFGVVICYEAIFPDLFRRFVRDGAGLMINITNDAWYGRTSAPYQHFSQAVLRAVENRVFLVRSANTGISGVVGPDGRVLVKTGIFERTSFVKEVGLRGSPLTFYTRYGDLFAWLNLLFSLTFIFVIKRA